MYSISNSNWVEGNNQFLVGKKVTHGLNIKAGDGNNTVSYLSGIDNVRLGGGNNREFLAKG